jgi:hypothetical protein
VNQSARAIYFTKDVIVAKESNYTAAQQKPHQQTPTIAHPKLNQSSLLLVLREMLHHLHQEVCDHCGGLISSS